MTREEGLPPIDTSANEKTAYSGSSAKPSGKILGISKNSGIFLVHLEPYSSNLEQTLAIAEGLRRDNWNMHIVCRASCRLAAEAAERGLSAHTVPDDAVNALMLAWRLLRIIRVGVGKSRASCLVHACDPTASRVASLAWRMNKKLRIVHTRRVPVMEATHNAMRRYQIPPAKVVTDSLAGKIALRLSGLEPHLLHTIPCGASASLHPERQERGDGRFIFGMTGEFMPDRGHSLLFDALAILNAKSDAPSWEIRILGDGPHLPALLEEAEAKDVAKHIIFLRGADVDKELGVCDGLVLPAAEGESWLPLILQGWGRRLALVTVNRLDHAEILKDEVNCLLVQPNDPAALAESMARLMRDAALRRRLEEGGVAALPKFGIDAMVLEHKRLYRGILA